MFRGLLPRRSIAQRQFLAMGTLITVTIAAGRNINRASTDVAFADVQSYLSAFGNDWWAWGDGRLAQINRALRAGCSVSIPEDMRELFRRAWGIRAASEGLFEPRVAELVHLWGFDDPARLRDAPPPQAGIDALLDALRSAPAYDEGDYGQAPGIGWDFGAIGKGYAVDACLAILARHGMPNASVDAGGNLAVRGRRGRRPWRIGIRDPRSGTDRPLLLGTLDARDEAVITHGDDQRYFEHGGRRYAHILDPRCGAPAAGLRSLTVVHPDAAYADAAGSALFVAGPDGWADLARKMQIDRVVAVRDDGRVVVTPTMAAQFHGRAGLQVERTDDTEP